jgi:hypothetical protein
VILAKITGRNAVEALPNLVDAGPAGFVAGQPARTQFLGEQPHHLAGRMRLDLIMRQIVGAARQLCSKLFRHRLHEG